MTTASRRYLLDTDIVSYALRGDASVADRVAKTPRARLLLSRITMVELSVLAHLRPARSRTRAALTRLRDDHPFVDLAESIWRRFGELKALVVRLGRAPGVTGDFDVLQAAIALERGLVLVTNNLRHFDVFVEHSGLEVENWKAPAR